MFRGWRPCYGIRAGRRGGLRSAGNGGRGARRGSRSAARGGRAPCRSGRPCAGSAGGRSRVSVRMALPQLRVHAGCLTEQHEVGEKEQGRCCDNPPGDDTEDRERHRQAGERCEHHEQSPTGRHDPGTPLVAVTAGAGITGAGAAGAGITGAGAAGAGASALWPCARVVLTAAFPAPVAPRRTARRRGRARRPRRGNPSRGRPCQGRHGDCRQPVAAHGRFVPPAVGAGTRVPHARLIPWGAAFIHGKRRPPRAGSTVFGGNDRFLSGRTRFRCRPLRNGHVRPVGNIPRSGVVFSRVVFSRSVASQPEGDERASPERHDGGKEERAAQRSSPRRGCCWARHVHPGNRGGLFPAGHARQPHRRQVPPRHTRVTQRKGWGRR